MRHIWRSSDDDDAAADLNHLDALRGNGNAPADGAMLQPEPPVDGAGSIGGAGGGASAGGVSAPAAAPAGPAPRPTPLGPSGGTEAAPTMLPAGGPAVTNYSPAASAAGPGYSPAASAAGPGYSPVASAAGPGYSAAAYGREPFPGVDPSAVPHSPAHPSAGGAALLSGASGVPTLAGAAETVAPAGMTFVAPEPGAGGMFTGAGMAAGGYSTGLLTAPATGTGEWITCPECGERAVIDSSHRLAEDFCKRCDFPLFWARSAVVPLSGEETGASLRRLPGTVGRAATAALICPHCGEPNSPVAQFCIRCTLNLHPEPEPEPIPEPVYVAPPPPEPEPEKGFPLWWVVVMCVCLVIITILVAWAALS